MGLAARIAIYILMKEREEEKMTSQNQDAKMVAEERKPARLHRAIQGMNRIITGLRKLIQDITLVDAPQDDMIKEAEPSLMSIFDTAEQDLRDSSMKIMELTAEISNMLTGHGGIGEAYSNAKEEALAKDTGPSKKKNIPERYDGVGHL